MVSLGQNPSWADQMTMDDEAMDTSMKIDDNTDSKPTEKPSEEKPEVQTEENEETENEIQNDDNKTDSLEREPSIDGDDLEDGEILSDRSSVFTDEDIKSGEEDSDSAMDIDPPKIYGPFVRSELTPKNLSAQDQGRLDSFENCMTLLTSAISKCILFI